MADPDLEDILKGGGTSAPGVLLHGPGGRSYFLPEAEAARFEVSASPEFEAFRSKRARTKPVERELSNRCANYLNYLENHEIDEQWRRVSTYFVNEC